MKALSIIGFAIGTIMAIWSNNPTATFFVFGAAILSYYIAEAIANKPEN